MEKTEPESPLDFSLRMLRQNRALLAIQKKRDLRFVWSKMAAGVCVLLALVGLLTNFRLAWFLPPAVVLLIVLAVAHERVLDEVRRLKSLASFYERALARLEDRWAGGGESGEDAIDPTHPYARDLDIFGAGSLFELLSTCRTRAGERELAHWLLEPASIEEIHSRQQAVEETKSRTTLRERLFLAGSAVHLGLHPEKLVQWAERAPGFGERAWSWAAAALAALWLAALISGLRGGAWDAFLAVCCVNLGLSYFFRRKNLSASVERIEEAAEDLKLLSQVLSILEGESFASPWLRGRQNALVREGVTASTAIARLDRITQALDAHHNLLIRVLDPFIFYSAQWAMRAEWWRRSYGAGVRTWLDTVGQMEALMALSNYAFEHPADVWPELAPSGASIEAEAFAHPLLPAGRAIVNDLKLDSNLQLMVLSGPNMAGKSTVMRGIGLLAVLAQCGAPVRARRFRISPLAVGASICVLDSLQGGVSRFYAEIQRLKLICDLARGPRPVLFLFDELLSGTNSHDRLEGTRMIARTLLAAGAIGMVSTHDLALTVIPDEMAGRAHNFHFEDHLEDGRLVFDYKLRPGVVKTSNALALMRSIGLADA
jgi:hypothetical protein